MKRTLKNRATLTFDAIGENESFSRVAVTGFVLSARASAHELADIKTAVSEAVTNCIVHAYHAGAGKVHMDLKLYSDGLLRVTITDRGCGIADIARAREPFFTTDREHERTGMGFAIMETFMSRVRVRSAPGKGTRVVMEKALETPAA